VNRGIYCLVIQSSIFPAKYVQGADAVAELAALCANLGKNALLIIGEVENGHSPGSYLGGGATRVLCMNTIFQLPACFLRKADSSQFCFVVPEASVMLPLLT
jgi:hypothetical protein